MKSDDTTVLTIKYAGLQGLYWMSFCSVYSFASVFLLSQEFENQQIGFLLALANILSVILQPTIGSWLDRTGKLSLKAVVSCLTLSNMALLTGLLLSSGHLVWSAVLYGGAVTLTLTIQPLLNSFIFEYINEGHAVNYGLTRGIGSISFAFLSLLLGLLTTKTNPYILPLADIALLTFFLLLVQTFPLTEAQKRQKHLPDPPDSRGTVCSYAGFAKSYNRFSLFLLALTCLFIFHTITNTYLLQIMKQIGGQDSDFGLSLTIAAVCELPAMLGFGLLVTKYTSGTLLKVAGFFYVIRSLLFLTASSVLMINFAQLFQGLSFALYTPASIYYVNELMNDKDKVKGQTFIVGATTLGSVFGSMTGGWLLDHASVQAMLLLGMAAALAGSLLLFYSVKSDLQGKS